MNIQFLSERAVDCGKWIILRRSDDKASNDNEWPPVGEWTRKPMRIRVHENGPEYIGHWRAGRDLAFCIYTEEVKEIVDIGDGEIEVSRAMIILQNSLPDNLVIEGDLDLRDARITSLPANLKVGGSLYLQGTAITSLPDNLDVWGDLDLEGTAITSLPDNLKVGGSLYLQGTAITSLPDNLEIGRNLDLQGTAITGLPDNLTIWGDLYLQGTAITSLPDSLSVGGWLNADTGITIPDNFNQPTG